MFYHASNIGNIKQLEPRISDHGIPLVYFSKKRENVLVYLSNEVEKYCRDTGFIFNGIWQKWGPYGFDSDGILRLEEYYPDALIKTYKGVSGYIYSVDRIEKSGFDIKIPDAVTSKASVVVKEKEFVPDALEAIYLAEREELIRISRYETLSENKKDWIARIVQEVYDNAESHPEYRHFLRGCFSDVLKV